MGSGQSPETSFAVTARSPESSSVLQNLCCRPGYECRRGLFGTIPRNSMNGGSNG